MLSKYLISWPAESVDTFIFANNVKDLENKVLNLIFDKIQCNIEPYHLAHFCIKNNIEVLDLGWAEL